MKPPQQSHIVIVGAARNVERTLAKQMRVFDRSFGSFGRISYVVVESDSSDRTTSVLSELKRRRRNFHYVSLGRLADEFPLRTQRIARARTAGLESCRKMPELEGADYIAVADWDGVNLQLTAKAVLSCWSHDGWDAATANQPEGYYDVWALRHPVWCPGDCWEAYHRLEKELGSGIAQQIAVASKRIKIPETHDAIDVDSAFGGLAIYKSKIFLQSSYNLPGCGEHEVCEHVSFHAEMKARGARIIINPALVNTYSHQDSLPLLSVERLAHTARRLIRSARGGTRVPASDFKRDK